MPNWKCICATDCVSNVQKDRHKSASQEVTNKPPGQYVETTTFELSETLKRTPLEKCSRRIFRNNFRQPSLINANINIDKSRSIAIIFNDKVSFTLREQCDYDVISKEFYNLKYILLFQVLTSIIQKTIAKSISSNLDFVTLYKWPGKLIVTCIYIQQ